MADPECNATMDPQIRRLTTSDLNAASAALRAIRATASSAACLVGFDGFIDSIIDAVATRSAPGPDGYTPMRSLRDFADRAQTAAGHSANIELVVKQTRIGGNGPILAGALAQLGATVHTIAATDHPVFDPLESACASTVHLGKPGATDCIEFTDGKLMLGKSAAMDTITWDRIKEAAGGIDQLIARCNELNIIAPLGWTMIPAMNDIWIGLATEILPNLHQPSSRTIFVDFSDPAKRTNDDLDAAIKLLQHINTITPVTLGLNFAEAKQIANRIGAPIPDAPNQTNPDSIAAIAQAIQSASALTRIAVHSHHAAVIAHNPDCIAAPTAFTPTPKTSTGAGDHFNAGLCFALAHNLDTPVALACAIATSGHFVRTAQHPSLDEVASFIDQIPA